MLNISGMEMNTIILRELAYQITRGNPWWGLAVANEYMDVHAPLRRALLTQLNRRENRPLIDAKIAEALRDGRCKAELPSEWQEQIGGRHCTVKKHLPAFKSSQQAARYVRRDPLRRMLKSENGRLLRQQPWIAKQQAAAS